MLEFSLGHPDARSRIVCGCRMESTLGLFICQTPNFYSLFKIKKLLKNDNAVSFKNAAISR